TNGFVKIESLKRINKPIIWTLHDMWAFTGGCHYDEECGKYKNNCGECPILKSNIKRDLSTKIFNRKYKTYKKIKNLTIIPTSNWLADCVKSSGLLKKANVKVIPTGVDTSTYKPIEKKIAKKILNLPADKKIIMFGALKSTTIKRKGYDYLISALKKVMSKDAEIVVFGASEPAIEIDLKFKMHYFSSLYDDISLSILYSAADVMVVPSIQENLGNTIMESLSCGTPVVAFDIGGNSDMIEHKQNGYLARAFDSTNLAEGIDYVIADENRQKSLSNEARKKIKERFDINIISKRYLKLYKEHC
ncbi:MAG: glycosyltransferase family 4 protein, partial [Spirochaetes bacterium]|nr:glycosyltransferase family 4 protein [Spirochaetota bacterium]